MPYLASSGELTVIEPPLDEHEVLVFLVQLALLVGVARILGAVMKSIGQPAVVGELLAGVLLGPSVFGVILPEQSDWVFGEPTVNSVVFGLAWLGVIMLLVVIGYETDLAIIAKFRRAAGTVSLGSLLIPFVLAAAVAFAVPDDFAGPRGTPTIFAGFFALALSVSALPVVAKILQDLGFLRRNFGQITLAAGMTMDSVGWLILAALSGVALNGSLDVGSLAASLGGLILFLVLAATVGRWLIDQLFRRSMAQGSSVTAALTISLLAALVGGAVTQALQLEAILGAFIVGILLATTRHQLPAARHTLETITASFFAPIFFAFSGLNVDLTSLTTGTAVAWTIGIILLAIVAKVFGSALGARLGGLGGRESFALGAGLSALGAMGVVVALLGLNLQVLSNSGYTVLVLAAIVTSLVAPQLIRVVVRGWDVPEEERDRLEKERLRDSSVLLGTSRILLPTRGGRNSEYAARLIELVFDEPEVTVFSVDVPTAPWWRRLFGQGGGRSADPTDVYDALQSPRRRLMRRIARDPAAAIDAESRFGYDLIVMGASEEDSDGTGLFSTVVDKVLGRASIPSMIVRFPAGAEAPDHAPTRILVPVTASTTTRAAEEIAYSMLESSGGSALALHVINRPEGQGMMLESPQVDDARRAAIEMLASAASLGSRLGVRVDTLVRVAPNAEEEIVQLANSGEYELLVIGTATRPLTNRPFFGHRVSYIIEHAEIPVAIITLPATS